jgi:hypothetical protein
LSGADADLIDGHAHDFVDGLVGGWEEGTDDLSILKSNIRIWLLWFLVFTTYFLTTKLIYKTFTVDVSQ